jgi:hypothetical protein
MTVIEQHGDFSETGEVWVPEKPRAARRLDESSDEIGPAPEALQRYQGFAEALAKGYSRDEACGRVRDQQVDQAYRESILLEALKPHLRDRWSACRVKRLADILGPWRRHDVTIIDLPSLVKVDEWLECKTQLVRRPALSDQQRRDLELSVAWVEAQFADCPAGTIFGVIAKLMIWRRRHARTLAHDKSFQRRHALAFAAYADLIRLTGLYSLTINDDRDAGITGHGVTPVASRRKVRKF